MPLLLAPTLAAVTLSLGDASTATVRSVPEGGDVALDLATTPSAALVWSLKRSAWTLDYTPAFGLIDVTRDTQLVILHGAGVSYSWSAKRLRLALGVRGTIGEQSYLSAARTAAPGTPASPGADPGPGQDPAPADAPAQGLLPQQEVVKTFSLAASVRTGFDVSRRSTAQGGVSYQVGGGRGDSARFIPLSRGPAADASYSYQLTLRDSLTTGLSWTLTDVPENGSRFVTVTLSETWSHRFAERTTGAIGAGVSYLRSRLTRDEAADNGFFGVGSASISQGYLLQGGANLGLSASATVDVGYNPLLGVVNQRVSGLAAASWQLDRTSVGANVQVSQTLPVDDPTSTLSFGAGAGVSYQLATPISLQAGVGWSRQILPDSAEVEGVSPDQWQAFIGVTLAAPPLTF